MSYLPISYVIKTDHRVVNQLYQNYLMCQGNYPMQQLFATQLLRELTKHALAEEAILYPAFEQFLGLEGKLMADKDRIEHKTAKQMATLLMSIPVTYPQYPYLLSSLVNDVNQHVLGEEMHDLPLLESCITPECSAYLAQLFQQTKLYIPLQYIDDFASTIFF